MSPAAQRSRHRPGTSGGRGVFRIGHGLWCLCAPNKTSGTRRPQILSIIVSPMRRQLVPLMKCATGSASARSTCFRTMVSSDHENTMQRQPAHSTGGASRRTAFNPFQQWHPARNRSQKAPNRFPRRTYTEEHARRPCRESTRRVTPYFDRSVPLSTTMTEGFSR